MGTLKAIYGNSLFCIVLVLAIDSISLLSYKLVKENQLIFICPQQKIFKNKMQLFLVEMI